MADQERRSRLQRQSDTWMEPARVPNFMGGGAGAVVTRAVFAALPPDIKPLRSSVFQSFVRRPPAVLAQAAETLIDEGFAVSTLLAAQTAAAALAADAAAPQQDLLATPLLPEPPLAPAVPAEFFSPPAAPLPPPPGAVEYAERLSAAVSALRLTSERLAEQARADALELALLVSRRILEAEISTNVEKFFGVIRSVIRRAGESHRVVVRLHPDDAARIEAAGGGRGISGMSVAQVEIAADAELELGDCMVDADFGVVDGRLTTRLDEMRRLLTEAMAAEEA